MDPSGYEELSQPELHIGAAHGHGAGPSARLRRWRTGGAARTGVAAQEDRAVIVMAGGATGSTPRRHGLSGAGSAT